MEIARNITLEILYQIVYIHVSSNKISNYHNIKIISRILTL